MAAQLAGQLIKITGGRLLAVGADCMCHMTGDSGEYQYEYEYQFQYEYQYKPYISDDS